MAEQIKRWVADKDIRGMMRSAEHGDSLSYTYVSLLDHDAEIAQRDARIGELERELATCGDRKHNTQVRLEGCGEKVLRIEAERDTAREMLRKYGKHANDCNSWLGVGTPGNYRCSCGLDQFLASLPKE